MRDGGDDRIVDSYTHKSNYSDKREKSREKREREQKVRAEKE